MLCAQAGANSPGEALTPALRSEGGAVIDLTTPDEEGRRGQGAAVDVTPSQWDPEVCKVGEVSSAHHMGL